ncbi:MAG: hypothetical protein ACOX06_02820 [Candidatus Dojkabacteria bacterium]|jgi:hypothetical protein
MQEESTKTKKLSLNKKQKILLAISILLFIVLCLEIVFILYPKKNKDTDVEQDKRSKKIVAELQEEEEELVIREEKMEEDVEKPSTEPSKSTTKPSEPKGPEKPIEEKVPEKPEPPKPDPLTPRQQVESLWTPDATSVIIDSKETITINGTKYLSVTVRRGTLKVGDTLKQTGICGIVPDVSTRITKMMKAGKLVNSATVSESVGIAMDNDYFYKRATFGTDMQLTTKVKLKVYVFTKEEGNTEEQSVVNNQGYILSFIPENPSGRPFIVGNGTPVI